ncbi:nucleotidyltransferase domain-containing protein [Microbacterium sp. PMB16]|uniref:nucleotidyltransferase domain-containing protein n=1 Tax=Microbacterium sp. PMB16 TaxID=3120157 RepID=UPI003F4C9E00
MSASPVPLPQPPSARPLPPAEFARWYGGWDPLTPESIGEFLAGFDRPWWIIGGWALEKSTGVSRGHEDLDISIAHDDAESLRLFLAERGWTTWNADDGWLRPFDGRFGEIRAESGIWVRRDATAPWILDIPLTRFRAGRWTNKRLPEQEYDLDEVTWIDDDGLRYLNPEIVLLMKLAQVREKDIVDARANLPLLNGRQRRWLSETIARIDPSHPWAALSD